ncbi:host cell division inhibitor Icd-like protein [Escherichia coli]|nr:host cell division inhibitor Icd-like protein [Escherichia coli]
MSDFVLDKTKATAEGHQWESYTLEHIANNARFAAGGQCDQCVGLLVGCSSGSVRCHAWSERIFQEYSLRYFSRANAHGANLSGSCSFTAFLRCFFLDEDNFFNDLSVIVYTCNPVRHSSLHHGADGDYSDSLALRRWRRLISPSSAETINCPVLSPSSFKLSTASAIAWGTRASSFFDFPLTAFVAISDSLVIRWLTVYTQENGKTLLTWLTPVTSIVADTFIKVIDEKTKPAGATNTNGLLTTNDRKRIEVAMLNHTTHPQGRDSHNLNKAGVKNQLIATASQGYDLSAPAKSGARIGVLKILKATYDAPSVFFYVVGLTHPFFGRWCIIQRLCQSMVAQAGASSEAPVSFRAGYANPVWATTSEIGVSGGSVTCYLKEAADMATTPTLVHSQTVFLWRFIALSTAQPRVIHIVATSEQEARQQSPAGCVMVFAARIRQEVGHD